MQNGAFFVKPGSVNRDIRQSHIVFLDPPYNLFAFCVEQLSKMAQNLSLEAKLPQTLKEASFCCAFLFLLDHFDIAKNLAFIELSSVLSSDLFSSLFRDSEPKPFLLNLLMRLCACSTG